MHGHHDHARHPEENNVETGYQHVGRMEIRHTLGHFRVVHVRPAQRAEGPQGRGEPGVEHVFVLTQFDVGGQIILRTYFGFVMANVYVALNVVPGRNAVAPPQLTGNTPVLNVAHPAEVHVFVGFRHKLNIAVFHRCNGWLGQGFGVDIPLVGQHWLNHHAATVAVGYG